MQKDYFQYVHDKFDKNELGYIYKGTIYKTGDVLNNWRERDVFILKPEKAGVNFFLLKYYDPATKLETGVLDCNIITVHENSDAALKFQSCAMAPHRPFVGLDIISKPSTTVTPRTLTIVIAHEDLNPLLTALYHASIKNNIRDFLRGRGKTHVAALNITPFVPRLANQLLLCGRTAFGCFKLGFAFDKCFGCGTNLAFPCLCCESYCQGGFLCERRDLIDAKANFVRLTRKKIKSIQTAYCQSCMLQDEDRKTYSELYSQFEEQEKADLDSCCCEEVGSCLWSRRKNSCCCDTCEIPFCQTRCYMPDRKSVV